MTKRTAVQTATVSGHGDSPGISTTSSGTASTTVEAGVSWPWSSTSSPRRRRAESASRSSWSQFGYALRTTGMTGKLYGGGGEVVAHSSVPPYQGSGPAGGPRKRLQTRLPKISSSPAVRMKAPTVSERLYGPQPSDDGYV